MWIEARLREAAPVTRVSIYYNGYRHARPNALRLLAFDGQMWVTVRAHISRDLDAFEFQANHPVYGNELKTIRFPPVLTDRLRIEIEEPDAGHDWTVGEIELYTPE